MPTTTSPETVKPLQQRDVMLIEFLRDHEAACPVCGYNLRSLTRPVCPECKQELTLTVGVTRLHVGWLLIALVPGFFSGIAACLLCIPTLAVYFEDGVLVLPFVGGVLFGWCSGIFSILLATRGRIRFLAQPRSKARGVALFVWLIHFIALALFFVGFASVIYSHA